MRAVQLGDVGIDNHHDLFVRGERDRRGLRTPRTVTVQIPARSVVRHLPKEREVQISAHAIERHYPARLPLTHATDLTRTPHQDGYEWSDLVRDGEGGGRPENSL